MFAYLNRILATFLALLIATNVFWTSFGCGGGANSIVSPTPEPAINPQSPQKSVVLYINDHLGNAHLITDSQGNILREESRYPYGLDWRVDGTDATTADYVYTGKEYDEETGLVYSGGRYYSPEMGRWTSPDPLFLEDPSATVKRPMEANSYSYVGNSPTNYIDADGKFAIAPLIGIGILAASYILTDSNVANAPAPGERLVSNPSPADRIQTYAFDAVTGYLGMRIFNYGFALIKGAETVASKTPALIASSPLDERYVSLYHGSMNDYRRILNTGLNPFKGAYVSRELKVAQNAISVLRYEVSQGVAKDMGIIESRVPYSKYDKYLRSSEGAYEYGFGTEYGVKLDSTQIILDTAEKVETFNNYIVKD